MIKESITFNSKTQDFLSKTEILNGLLYSDDLEQIQHNIDVFAIEFDENISKKGTVSNVSKRDSFAVITLEFNEKSKAQYLISNALDLKKVNNISEQIIPQPFKKLIQQAYEMTKANKTLGDFLNFNILPV